MKGNSGRQRVATLIMVAATIWSLIGTVQAQTPVLYGVNSADDSLSVVDPATGRVRLIGPLDPNNQQFVTPVAMAVRPSDGQIFAWNNGERQNTSPFNWITPPGLVTVDPCTGVGTLVGNSPDVVLGAIAFSPTGDLFGASNSLYQINQDTGGATAVGNIGVSLGGLAFDSQGVLYGAEYFSGTFLGLVTINTANGSVITSVNLNTFIGVLGDIVFDRTGETETLIGSAFNGPQGDILFDINPTVGTVSNVRQVSGGFPPQGMGFAPACVPPALAKLLDPNGGTNEYKFPNEQANLYNYKVTYPRFDGSSNVDLVVTPTFITQKDLEAMLGDQFSGATLVPYDWTGGYGVLFSTSCKVHGSVQTTDCPIPGLYDVKTSWDSAWGESILQPAFVKLPTGSTVWENILTDYIVTRVDPTGSGRTCCKYSEFVFVDGVTGERPDITITTPLVGAIYTVNQSVAANYSCTGNYVVNCLGPAPSGSPIDTSSVGTKSFQVNATVSSGPSAVETVSYKVGVVYNTDGCLLYDWTKSVKKGAAYPIKLQVCDAAGKNLSAPNIVLHAVAPPKKMDNSPDGPIIYAGNANPDFDFRFDSTLGVGGGYIYNLKTTGLSSGTWKLYFTITGDPDTHSALFNVK